MVKFDEPTVGSVWIVPDAVKFVQANHRHSEQTRVYFGLGTSDYLLLDHPVEYVVRQLWPAESLVPPYDPSFLSNVRRWLRGK